MEGVNQWRGGGKEVTEVKVGEGEGSEEGVKGEKVQEKERAPLTLCSVKTINSTFL